MCYELVVLKRQSLKDWQSIPDILELEAEHLGSECRFPPLRITRLGHACLQGWNNLGTIIVQDLGALEH